MLHEVFVLEARVDARMQVLCSLCYVHHPMQLEGAVEVCLPVLQVGNVAAHSSMPRILSSSSCSYVCPY